jgi:hypothetical protein
MASATLLTAADLTDLGVELNMAKLMVEAIQYQENLTKTLGVPPGWSMTVVEEIKAVKKEHITPGTQTGEDVQFLGCFSADGAEAGAAGAVPAPPSFSPPPVPVVHHKQTLKPGWEAATEPSSGKVYYWNVATNETSWDAPWDTAAVVVREQRQASSSAMMNQMASVTSRLASHSLASNAEYDAVPPVRHAKKVSTINAKVRAKKRGGWCLEGSGGGEMGGTGTGPGGRRRWEVSYSLHESPFKVQEG